MDLHRRGGQQGQSFGLVRDPLEQAQHRVRPLPPLAAADLTAASVVGLVHDDHVPPLGIFEQAPCAVGPAHQMARHDDGSFPVPVVPADVAFIRAAESR